MTTVNDIQNFIDSLANEYTRESWDNVGLLLGRRDKEVKKVLVALDPFSHVCDEAVRWGADLLVTHHPLIFQPVKAVNGDTETGRCILTLAASGIAAINAHTNLDKAARGVNWILAQQVGLDHIQVMNPEGQDSEGREIGLIRIGFTKTNELPAFLAQVRQALGCKGLRYVDGGKPVHQVAVGGGACSGAIDEVVAAGCDTFVTSDIKYNQFWTAKDLGLNLIDAGHFYTENPVCEYLAQQLRTHFPEIEVKISETHADCMEFA